MQLAIKPITTSHSDNSGTILSFNITSKIWLLVSSTKKKIFPFNNKDTLILFKLGVRMV